MKKQKLVFPFLSFLLAMSTQSCVLYGVKEVQLVTTDYLEVDLIKREYFINEEIDFSDCTVYGVDSETGEKKEVSYTVRWESSKNKIEGGDIISVAAGQYRWVFSSEGYKNYSLGISVYEATSESFYISEYPTHQYFYSNSDNSYFTAEGLICKRKLTYSTNTDNLAEGETRDSLQKIYDVPIKDCSFSTRISSIDPNNNISLKEGYKFPEGTKGIFTVSVTTTSFLNTGKRTSPATYKINITDSLTSSTLSLNDFDESTITKYNTDDTITLTITNTAIDSERQTGTDNFISPDNVDNSFGMDYLREKNDLNQIYCPSKGDVPILVIPFYYNNAKSQDLLSSENLELIDKCFFGNSNDLYYESLRSYYFKSSYGQLNFYGYVAPPFNPQADGTATRNIKYDSNDLPSLDDNQLVPLIKDAVNFVKRTGVDMRDFDSNGDGYIDALWFISFSPIGLTGISSVGWPHTNNLLNTVPNVSDPAINMFSWTPIGTLNNDFYANQAHTRPGATGKNYLGDAHTIIHETGHLLGLNDYYSTAGSEVYSFKNFYNIYTQATYAPLGGLDFMDKNYLDFNPYSKLLLGWTKPYLVYGNSTITIKPSLYKNQVVVIPYDSFDYSDSSYINDKNETIFNPYDEYLVLDFFTPNSDDPNGTSYITDNLNTKDYDVYKTTKLTNEGIRIYHADKRGLICSNDVYYEPDDPFNLLNLDDEHYLACPITNTEYGSFAERGANNRKGRITQSLFPNFDNYCDEIRLLTVDPNEFVDGSYVIGDRYSSSSKLSNQLKVNGVIFPRGESFSTASYTEQVEVKGTPQNMKPNEARNTLSCFGFLSVLLNRLEYEDYRLAYLRIAEKGFSNYYTTSQWTIMGKVFNKTALTQSEQNVFDALSLPPGIGRASFNNGSLCSYSISIS